MQLAQIPSAMNTTLPTTHRVSVFFPTAWSPGERICARLGVAASEVEGRTFEDGEHKLRPMESVRGRDVYVVESFYSDDLLSVNDKLVRALFLLAALRDAGAARVTCVAPYLCYSRMDRRSKPRDPVSSRYVANLLEAVGVDRVVTVDVHDVAAFENSFRIATEHLTAAPALIEALLPHIGGHEVAVVSPDSGGLKRADAFRKALERRLGRSVGFAFVEKYRDETSVRTGALSGDVENRIAILLDDLISTGTTLARAAATCRDAGARSVIAAATHGVLSSDAPRLLHDSAIEHIVLLDTIPERPLHAKVLEGRAEFVDCAPLLASAIHQLHTNGSISELAQG